MYFAVWGFHLSPSKAPNAVYALKSIIGVFHSVWFSGLIETEVFLV